jgi:protein SDA1
MLSSKTSSLFPQSTCKALILIRNKGQLTALDLLTLFFELLRCQDKSLRAFLHKHIVTDIKNMNSKHKDVHLNSKLQNFMYSMVNDADPKASKLSLDVMIELYHKNVWRDAKTVNVIAQACFSSVVKNMVTAIKFFLGNDDSDGDEGEKSDSDDDDDPVITSKEIKSASMANRVNKKTSKRQKQVKRLQKAMKKQSKKEKKVNVNFSALHLIYDPQGMAEKLFNLLQKSNERFEVKLMIMNLISRLVGVHELFLFNFYPLIQRYLQPHQKEVTKILVYAAQSCHSLIPPDILQPVLRTVVDNFVSERNSNECITVGLNTVREICTRCPLVMTEELLQDLVMYQKYKDKNVSMSARSLVRVFRVLNPHLLQKKDRGRPTEASTEFQAKEYREFDAPDFVPGAEILVKKKIVNDSDQEEDDESDWKNESNSDGEDGQADGWETDEDAEEVDDGDDGSDWSNVDPEEGEHESVDVTEADASGGSVPVTSAASGKQRESKPGKASRREVNEQRLREMREEAARVSSSRILTDKEFQEIRRSQLRKQVEAMNPRLKKRKHESEDEDDDSPDEADAMVRPEIVPLASIERLYKKGKADKDSRLATVHEGRQGREKFGRRKAKMNPFSSTREKEKRKKKAFPMIKYKVKGKKKKSFQDKQQRLRHSLLKQSKIIK